MGAVTEDGELYTWGYGSNGRLGHGDEKDQSKPTRVQWFVDQSIRIKRVFCGGHHTIAVAEDGSVFGFGWTHHGQLGVGEIAHGDQGTVFPKPLETLQGHRILNVGVAEQHTLCLTTMM
jgi:alpha-tubulin suppressor-like RCC1 family protein